MKKSFRIKLKVQKCDIIFSEGIEPGVLGFKDVDYDLTEEEYKHPLFIKSLLDEREALLEEIIEFEVEENK